MTSEPAFQRRREIGAASARSLLLTVLGEFVLPAGEPVWTAAFLDALASLDVEEKAVRQALARSATEGWLAAERHGRRTAWRLTPDGRRLLSEGAERIYGFGAPMTAWDGQWLIVLASVPESNRKLRHHLRTRLAWSGLGNLSPGIWVTPHPEREAEVHEVLTEAGVAATATIFVGRLGDVEEARRVAGQAWDLSEIELAYEDFLAEVGALHPGDDRATFTAQVRLVQEWRRFPFLDPGLPSELLPAGWSGTRAVLAFQARHDGWRAAAGRHWRTLSAQA
ncbi:PaaX family transcriptional regulator C-terminal domain-containing protein [Spirillospora sp. NPDC048911]|uniref:PaaX family transcriptional regulator n=1 Tax=Spirillospora sp. NPDC048911 TaxID=3364527 RepID=UPI00371AEAAF